MIAALMLLALQASNGAPPPPAAGQQSSGPQVEAPGAATQAAQQWLAMVDRGDAAGSWQATGAMFRSKVTEADWARDLPRARQQLGAVGARHPDGELPLSSLPNAPAGSYRIVRFDTEFANHKEAVETVVTVKEGGGWRVVGFFVGDPDDTSGQDQGSAPPANRR